MPKAFGLGSVVWDKFGFGRRCVVDAFGFRPVRTASRYTYGSVNDTILKAILDTLPLKQPRSRLEPYAALIAELRGRDWSYRSIAKVLEEKCGLKTAPSTIYDFVRTRKWQANGFKAAD